MKDKARTWKRRHKHHEISIKKQTLVDGRESVFHSWHSNQDYSDPKSLAIPGFEARYCSVRSNQRYIRLTMRQVVVWAGLVVLAKTRACNFFNWVIRDLSK